MVNKSASQGGIKIPSGPLKFLLYVGAAILLVIIIFTACCTVVDSGEVGIKFHKWSASEQDYGGVEGTCKGWVFYNPITTSVFTYPPSHSASSTKPSR